MVTHLAIKTDDSNSVLKIFDKYFSDNYGLGIGEIKIGGNETPFTKGKKNFKDWRDYNERIGLIRINNNIDINTDFELFFNLKDNKDWLVFLFYARRGFRGYFNENDYLKIAELISKEMKCDVIIHTYNDSTGYKVVHRFQNGALLDEMELDESEILVKKGYFENFADSIYGNTHDFAYKIYFPFLHKHSFYPDSEDFEIIPTDSWRAFYLDGDINDLKKYLGRIIS